MSKPFPPKKVFDRSVPRIFKPGARHYLHPKLVILDQIDCVLEYFPENKIIIVSFAPEIRKKDFTDYEEKVYTKSVMSSDINFVIETINKDYIIPLRDQINESLKSESENNNEHYEDN